MHMGTYDDTYGKLIGKTIQGIGVSDDQHWLRFETPRECIYYEAIGDCCSESWFADITGVEALLGAQVMQVEEVDIENTQPERTRQEYDCIYGLKITTNRGYGEVIFRNSSNGYYSGWLEKVNGPGDDDIRWENITATWSA